MMATTDCKTNSDVTTCPTPYTWDTTANHLYCLPDGEDVAGLMRQVYESMDQQNDFGKYISDLQNCWQAIVGMCFGTFVIAIIYVFLLKYLVKPLLYISMILILAGFLLLGGWCWI